MVVLDVTMDITPRVEAITIYVDDDYGYEDATHKMTIQAAVDAANPGDSYRSIFILALVTGAQIDMHDSHKNSDILYDSGIVPRTKKYTSTRERLIELISIIGGLIAGFFTIGYVIISYNEIIISSVLEWILLALGIFLALFIITAVIMGAIIGTDIAQITIVNESIIIKFRSIIFNKQDRIIPMLKSTKLYSNENSQFPQIIFLYENPDQVQKEIFLLFKDDIPNITRFLQIVSEYISVDRDTFCNYAIARKIARKE